MCSFKQGLCVQWLAQGTFPPTQAGPIPPQGSVSLCPITRPVRKAWLGRDCVLGCDLHPPGRLPSPLPSHCYGDLLSTVAKTSRGTEDCASRSWSVPRACSYNFSFCTSGKNKKELPPNPKKQSPPKERTPATASAEGFEKAPVRISSIMIMAHTPS